MLWWRDPLIEAARGRPSLGPCSRRCSIAFQMWWASFAPKPLNHCSASGVNSISHATRAASRHRLLQNKTDSFQH